MLSHPNLSHLSLADRLAELFPAPDAGRAGHES